MSELSASLAWALALVFLSAGLGKLASKPTFLDGGVAITEVALGTIIILGFLPQQAALIAFCLTCGYAIYALTRRDSHRCRCFGQRLPSSGRGAQQVRNLFLASLSGLYFILSVAGERHAARALMVDIAAAFVLAAALIVVPWILEWGFAGELDQRK
jgi:uncharacterized membrane protein YphA (DoxX/SURF4 family)